MWFSNKHKALFIHPIKTAGTSIEVALEICGQNCFHAFQNHSTIRDAEKVFKLDSLFKFASIRNPWDWEVSHYHWILQQHEIDKTKNPAYEIVSKYESFDDYVKNCLANNVVEFEDQTSYLINSNGSIAVDKLIRYENLRNDLISACKNFMSDEELSKLRLGHFLKTNREHYKEYYSNQSKQIIESMRWRDIKNFNYEY